MAIVQEIGKQVKWLVASCRNDVMGFITIGLVVGVFVRIFVFH